MYLKKILAILLFAGFWICLAFAFYLNSLFGITAEMTILNNKMPVCATDKIQIINEQYILVHNKASSLIQFYDLDGQFVWGVQYEDSRNIDGSLISCSKEDLYVLEDYTNTVYTFTDFELVKKEKKESLYSDIDFYSEYPPETEAIMDSKIKNGKVYMIDRTHNLSKEVLLNTKFIPVSPIFLFGFSIVLIGGFWILKKEK